MKTRCRLALALGLAMTAALVHAATAPLQMSWEVVRNEFTAQHPAGRSLVALEIANRGSEALPAAGWAIYFSAIAGVETGAAVEGHVRLERVIGTLFRIRPETGFIALAPAHAMRIAFYQPEVMLMMDKAPQAPYLVYDDRPEVGLAVADYRIVPSTRPEQVDMGPGAPVVGAEALYARQAAIVDLPPDALPPVFPPPLQYQRGAGTLVLTSAPRVQGTPALRAEMALARAMLQPLFASTKHDALPPPLRLSVGAIAGQPSAEAYELVIDAAAGIAIQGRTAAGVSRGLQTLRSLLPAGPSAAVVALQPLRIVDAPRFEYRGLMLDVARNFQDKATLLRLLDLMARYKLNKLHLHLTDDEGWRIEIDGLPELTGVGARRGHPAGSAEHLPPAHGSGPALDDPHGSGHYTRADYIEILRYAAARRIEVIPEIEMPGHARAAVKAMEWRAAQRRHAGLADADRYRLSDPGDRSQYRSAQLYSDNVIDPGLPSSYAFIERVVAALVAMHRQAGVPLRTLHVGGDELPRGAWEQSPASRAAMHKLKEATTAALWDRYYERVDAILRAQGLVAAGWEELGSRKSLASGDAGLEPNPAFVGRGFQIYVWNNAWDTEDLAYQLANAGYTTILAPVTNLYFDMAHLENPYEHGHNWARYIDLDTVFDLVPLDMLRSAPTSAVPRPGQQALTEAGRRHIRGLEATLFSETLREPRRIDAMLMPRLLALAERAWSADPAWARETDPERAAALHRADWSRFVNQLGKQVLPRLDAEAGGVAYRIPPPGLRLVDGRVEVNSQLPGLALRYTSDDTEPLATSAAVVGPIAAKGAIRVAAFDRNGRGGRSSRLVNP